MEKKVLIIEDDLDVAKIVLLRFQAAGFECRHVADAAYGVKEAHLLRPDVIILDLMLPAGGGWTVLKNLRLSLHTKATPVIVYTGMESEDRKKEIEAYGVQAIYQKPYDIQKIVEKAQELVSVHLGTASQNM